MNCRPGQHSLWFFFSSQVYSSEMLTSICSRKLRSSRKHRCRGDKGIWQVSTQDEGQDAGRLRAHGNWEQRCTVSWIQSCHPGRSPLWVRRGVEHCLGSSVRSQHLQPNIPSSWLILLLDFKCLKYSMNKTGPRWDHRFFFFNLKGYTSE